MLGSETTHGSYLVHINVDVAPICCELGHFAGRVLSGRCIFPQKKRPRIQQPAHFMLSSQTFETIGLLEVHWFATLEGGLLKGFGRYPFAICISKQPFHEQQES